MYVPYKQIVQMLETAFCAGQNLSSDLQQQTIEEIIVKNNLSKPAEFRVYSVEELRGFPLGSQFCHSLLGKGSIVAKRGMRSQFMKFESGVTNGFTADAFPWDMPMIYVGEEKSEDKHVV